jgi:hypothetical protein
MGQTGSTTLVAVPATPVAVAPQTAQFLQMNQAPNSLIVVPPGSSVTYSADGTTVRIVTILPNGGAQTVNLGIPYVTFPFVMNPTPLPNQINVFPPQSQMQFLSTQRRTVLKMNRHH